MILRYLFKTALDTMFGTNSGGTPKKLVAPSAAFANGMVSGAIKSSGATAAGTYGLSHAAGSTTFTLTNGVQNWTATAVNGVTQTIAFDNGVSVDLTSAFATATVNTMVKFDVTTAGKVDLEFQTGALSYAAPKQVLIS